MDKLIQQYRKKIVEIARGHGAKTVKIFGSFARGEEREDSDIDLLVEMEPGRSLLDIIAIKYGVEDFTERHVDVVTPTALSPYIADEILRDAVEL